MNKIIKQIVQPDNRIDYLKNVIVPAVEKHLNIYLAENKLSNSITFEDETIKFLSDLKLLVEDYTANFIVEVEETIDITQTYNRLNDLNLLIQSLNDKEQFYLKDKLDIIYKEKDELENNINQINLLKETNKITLNEVKNKS